MRVWVPKCLLPIPIPQSTLLFLVFTRLVNRYLIHVRLQEQFDIDHVQEEAETSIQEKAFELGKKAEKAAQNRLSKPAMDTKTCFFCWQFVVYPEFVDVRWTPLFSIWVTTNRPANLVSDRWKWTWAAGSCVHWRQYTEIRRGFVFECPEIIPVQRFEKVQSSSQLLKSYSTKLHFLLMFLQHTMCFSRFRRVWLGTSWSEKPS